MENKELEKITFIDDKKIKRPWQGTFLVWIILFSTVIGIISILTYLFYYFDFDTIINSSNFYFSSLLLISNVLTPYSILLFLINLFIIIGITETRMALYFGLSLFVILAIFLNIYFVLGILKGWRKLIITILFYYVLELIFILIFLGNILIMFGFGSILIVPVTLFVIYLLIKCSKHPFYE